MGTTSHVFADSNQCFWELYNEHGDLLKDSVSDDFLKNPTLNVGLLGMENIVFQCKFSEYADLNDALINFKFFVQSEDAYDITFSLIDVNGHRITSKSIMNWYGLILNKQANLSIYPYDLKPNENFLFDNVTAFQVNILSPNVKSLEILNVYVNNIPKYDTFDLYDNLPIQPILPEFLALIFITIPSGIVLTYSTGFLKKENFFMKIPWILGIGFATYVVISFLISLFWISFESMFIFLIAEYSIFALYVIKNKNRIQFPDISNSKTTIAFFLGILIISAVLSLTTIGSVAWPMDPNDGLSHLIMISLTMHHNKITDGGSQSYLPIRNTPPSDTGTFGSYPKGAHTATAGLSFLSGNFPGVSFATTTAFLMFIIQVMLASIVYRLSHSIFYSGIMFLISFWRPSSLGFWYGDLVWNNWIAGHYASLFGIIFALISFMILLELFSNNRKKLILLLSLNLTALSFAYYAFLPLLILISLTCFIVYFIQNKKKSIAILSLIFGFIISLPFWGKQLGNYALSSGINIMPRNVTPHSKFLTTDPFDPSSGLFLFWVSSLVALFSAIFLLKDRKYRVFSIIFIIISLIHLLSIIEYVYDNHLFFNANLRSLGLMFFLSFAMNLIMIHFITKKLSTRNAFSQLSNFKIRTGVLKIVVLFFILILLSSSFIRYYQDVELPNRVVKVPGGNDKNLLIWLYENTDSDELILNDHSYTGFWYIGFKAQSMINFFPNIGMIARTYDSELQQFNPQIQVEKETVQANHIFKNPWDYEYIEKTVGEQDIKYIFLSERKTIKKVCRPQCYPDSQDWSWRNYDGNARIGMYENHPSLELILRNGNSAIFKVI